MITLTVVDREGATHTIETGVDCTLMEAIRDYGITEEFALCGGNCSCATCHVIVDPAMLSKMSAISSDEEDLLDGSEERQAGSRLSCQVALSQELDGLQVTVAATD